MKQITIIEQQDNIQFTLYDNMRGSILREFQGFEYPSVRESIDDVAGPYGSVYVTSKFGRRRASIEGDLVGSDVYQLRRNLLRALRQTGVIKLIKFTTYDNMELQFEAEVVKLVNPYTHTIHTFLLELVAPDWRFYSQELINEEIVQSSIQGGGVLPGKVPYAIPLQTTGETQLDNILENEGNETTDPVLTITGPGNGFIIGNLTVDKQLTFNRALSEDDVVIIDVRRRTVVLNGITNVYPDLSGDFWSLVPGENEIRFFVQSGLTTATKLEVSYRHAYSGI